MPKQGQSVESCILTEWFKAVGESVSKGDLLFAYETDKAAFEEEAKEDGILLAQFFEAGDEVPVLVNVAVIGEQGESVDSFRPGESRETGVEKDGASGTGPLGSVDKQGGPKKEIATRETTEAKPVPPGSGDPEKGGVTAGISPRARRLAEEKRVITAGMTGTGPGGRIIERDVLEEIRLGKRLTPLARKKMESTGYRVPDAGKKPYGRITSGELEKDRPGETLPETDGEYSEEPLSNVRKLIAGAMFRSLQNSAQLTHHLGANATAMLNMRKKVKRRLAQGHGNNITLNDMVCYAVIRALKDHPGANAHYLEGTIRKFHPVHLGLAVDTDRGLLVPALRNADQLSLTGLSVNLRKLADNARLGKVPPDLLAPEGATFTVSNLGNYGVEMFTPVINLPQVGILGVNAIVQRPSPLPDGTFGFLPYIGLSLTYDHRALDGGPATLFLASIRNQIESLTPELLDT